MSKAEEFEARMDLFESDGDAWKKADVMPFVCENRALIARALRTQEMVDNLPEALAHDVGLVARSMAGSGGDLWTTEEIGSGCIAAFREAVK